MRWIAGLLLVAAAVLKAAQLVSDPASALLNPLGRYFLPTEIGGEFAVGTLLLNGHNWRMLRWFVLMLFTAFAGYSIYMTIIGAASWMLRARASSSVVYVRFGCVHRIGRLGFHCA